MYELNYQSEDEQAPAVPEVVCSLNGRRRRKINYKEESDDEEQEEEEEEEEEAYYDDEKDEDYHVDSDLSNDSSCLNYDAYRKMMK